MSNSNRKVEENLDESEGKTFEINNIMNSTLHIYIHRQSHSGLLKTPRRKGINNNKNGKEEC